jgi:pantetheine-phosphate adenylyltransferase
MERIVLRMRLIFLGTGGSAETPFRHTTGLYLPDWGILLDAGANVFPLRALHGDGPLHVLMSHYHLDHSIGIYFLAAGLFYGRSQPEITLYGPEWEDRFQDTAGPESPLFPIPLPFAIRRAPKQFNLGPVEVSTCPVPHTAPVLAYRLRFPSGETLGYVTDTTAPGEYADFVRGVDVLVHECTFSRRAAKWAGITRHSETAGVALLAREAGVGQLYLTHLGPLEDGLALLDEVRAEFPRTDLAVEGLEYPRPSSVDPRRAIFPGSFDPLTVSHLDIIHTCLEMFHSLHVVVARNPAKDAAALFTPQERLDLIRRCVPSSVSVKEWGGLTVDYARRAQAGRIVRGLGRAEDYNIEVRLWKTNALLASEIQTVWVPPRAEHLDVSSSMVKEAGLFGGWEGVRHLVPEPIRDAVGARIDARRGKA